MTIKSLFKILALSLMPFLMLNAANAQWSLDNAASKLSFVSVKADNVAEVHSFDMLTGTIGDDGDVEIGIELASVNTMIPIRNERMQAMLFETGMFPKATISANVDLASVAAMEPGTTKTVQLQFDLNLHGVSNSYSADVMLSRTLHGVLATTMKPIIVTAESFGLTAGVEQLREVAGLTRISNAVPVSFTVVFTEGH